MNYSLNVPALFRDIKGLKAIEKMPTVPDPSAIAEETAGVRHLYEKVLIPYLKGTLNTIHTIDLDAFDTEDIPDIYDFYAKTYEQHWGEYHRQANIYRQCERALPIPSPISFL